ncbi:TetR/AcrR family transcriptional regulator C-terminal domain-containing protein [Paenarthrobacter sp. Z7-10]|uniref:TetR/AcrR family transcriptional regulator n=1 Tax=Paenarthrobacter sp. Z7-10 TaxID=2787635 RepID=UPI0022A9E46E|nr:TetR/AcrR family transcriptional regulator [Paenarthrobacter sp. Z7-10]MCZ2404559.1 TetR/AcrR family transcriptional regulator C-terminal domain-containing protein [Paenarthrobacter sp. Z7-10]
MADSLQQENIQPDDEEHGLNRNRILDAGAAYIENYGLRQLTMRKLGAELGVEAMALYRYVPSRDDLMDGIVERVINDLFQDPEVPGDAANGWQDYLIRLAHGLRRLALTHPQVFPLIATRPPEAPWIRPPLRSLRWTDSFLAALTSSGFSDKPAVAAYRGFSSFLLGHLLLEVASHGADIGPEESADPSKPRSATDLTAFPHIHRMQAQLSEDRSAEEFEESLEVLIERIGLLAES